MTKRAFRVAIVCSLLLCPPMAEALLYLSGVPPSGDVPQGCFLYQNFEGQDPEIFDNGEEWTGYDYGWWTPPTSYPPAALRGRQSLHMNPAGMYPIVYSPQFDARSEIWVAWRYRQFGDGNPNEECGECYPCGLHAVVTVTASDYSILGGAFVHVVPGGGIISPPYDKPCEGDSFALVHGSSDTLPNAIGVHPGTTRHFWMYFKLSTGSGDGIVRIWRSPDRWRPEDPILELTDGTATASIRHVRIENGYYTEDSSGRRGYILDQVMACDSEITEMPE